jgi:DNA topoisomerase IA
MSSKAASLSAMEELHNAVAQALKEGIAERDPKMLAEAIKFLKNNGIEAARDTNKGAISRLADQVSQIMAAEDPDYEGQPIGRA